eukprot:6117002-Amphidinium_carterae.1
MDGLPLTLPMFNGCVLLSRKARHHRRSLKSRFRRLTTAHDTSRKASVFINADQMVASYKKRPHAYSTRPVYKHQLLLLQCCSLLQWDFQSGIQSSMVLFHRTLPFNRAKCFR